MPEEERNRLLQRLEALERQAQRFDIELRRLRHDVERHSTSPAVEEVRAPGLRAREAVPPEPPPTPAPVAGVSDEPRRRRAVEIEFWLGGRGLLLLGVLALVFSVGFFVKEAIERGWIGPAVRVLLGIAVGMAAVGVGERLRAIGYRTYGLWLAAGGFGAIYLSIWAAAALYALVPAAWGFLLMVAVVVAAAALGLLRASESFVALAAFGGYLAPLLIQVDTASNLFALGYLGLLSGAGLWVSFRARWQGLAAVAVLGGSLLSLTGVGDPYLHGAYLAILVTAAMVVARLRHWPEVSLLTIALGWTVLAAGHGRWELTGLKLSSHAAWLWLANLIGSVGVTAGYRPEAADSKSWVAADTRQSFAEVSGLAVTLLPPWLFLILAMAGLGDSTYSGSRDVVGFALGIFTGAVYLTQSILIRADGEPRRWPWAVYLGYALWIVAPWILWDGASLARVWLLEGAVLTGAGVALRSLEARSAGLAAFAVAALTYSAAAVNRPDLDPAFFSVWALTGLASAIALAAWGLALELLDEPAAWEIGLRPVLMLLSALLFLSWGTLEIQRFFELLADDGRWNLARDLSISGFWIAYAVALLTTGFWLKRAPVRWAGLVMALIAAAKVFLYDLSQLSQLYRILSFVLLAVVLLALSFRYQKLRRTEEEPKS